MEAFRAYVPLPHGLSARVWADRHSAGDVPDSSPYGLHRLADHDVAVEFGEAQLGRVAGRIAASGRYRLSGAEIVEALSMRGRSTAADAILAYDERTGIPAALVHRREHPPVALGIGWLTTRADTPRPLAALAARALPRATTVWSQCAPVLDLMGPEWGVASARKQFVPLGIDTDFYALQPQPEHPGLVVSAGEDRYRDHALLIAAVAAARAHTPSVHLELATGLPVHLPPDLGRLHTGRLDGRMRDLYRRSSVVAIALHPTVTGSGLTVVLEAMASGRPVIVTANPGIDDYLTHGEHGLLVPPGDVDAFTKAISELVADPARCAEMGHRAATRVRTHFSSAVMAGALASMLRSM